MLGFCRPYLPGENPSVLSLPQQAACMLPLGRRDSMRAKLFLAAEQRMIQHYQCISPGSWALTKRLGPIVSEFVSASITSHETLQIGTYIA